MSHTLSSYCTVKRLPTNPDRPPTHALRTGIAYSNRPFPLENDHAHKLIRESRHVVEAPIGVAMRNQHGVSASEYIVRLPHDAPPISTRPNVTPFSALQEEQTISVIDFQRQF